MVEQDDKRESEMPPADDEDGWRRRRLEKMLGGAIRRGLEAGIGTLTKTDNVVREIVGENVKLPKELVGYIFSQVDETKNAMVRVVAGEVRDFLQATDLATELQKALTTLSFEIKTEIRFIPNDSGGVKPDVKAEVTPKRRKRQTEAPPKAKSDAPPKGEKDDTHDAVDAEDGDDDA